MATALELMTLVCALASSLVAGVFFAFSTFVMRALARLPAPQGIAAMQSINVAVIHPAFLGPFVGNALACLGLAVASVAAWQRPGAAESFAGALLYALGTFGVTMAGNVPLNNALAAVDPASAEGARVWADYLRRWTFWNHVRTVAAAASAALLTLALAGSPG